MTSRAAPVYRTPSLPTTLQPDTGRHHMYQDSTRIPKYPFEVVFQAAEIMNPAVRFDGIDVLVNRNSLRKFFHFCRGRTQQSFRVDLHLVANTLIVERRVRSTIQFLYGSGGSGFGHNFEKAATRLPQGLADSSGHHRVLRYGLGGLQCAVRFEADAYYDGPELAGAAEAQGGGAQPTLATSFSLMAVGGERVTTLLPAAKNNSGISAGTLLRGSGTPQERIAELKSRSDAGQQPKSEWLPQLWFGRTRYLVTGHHSQGVFDRVQTLDLEGELEAWEKHLPNQQALQKMVVLLSRLREVVRGTEAKACVVIGERAVKPPAMRIHACTSGKGPLPDAVVERFWGSE